MLRLLQLHRLPGVNTTTGGELQTVLDARGRPTSSQRAGGLERERGCSSPTTRAREAWLLQGGRLHPVWSNGNGGTSPVVAGSLLFVAGSGVDARLRPDERHGGRDAAVRRRALAEPDRRRRPRRDRRGQRERPRDERRARHLHAADDEALLAVFAVLLATLLRLRRGALRGDALHLVRVAQVHGAGVRDCGAGRAGQPLRRRAGGPHPRARERPPARDAVPRHPPAGQERRRAGAALGRLRSRVRDEPPLLRRLHRHERRHARRAVPLERHARRSRRRRSSCSSSRTSRRTTTAASCSSGPTAGSTGGTATAAAAAIPSTTGRTSARPFAKIMRLNVNAPTAALAARRLRAAQPVALLVRPRERRPLHRRRRPGRVGGDRLPEARHPADRQLRLEPLRGARTSTTPRRRCSTRGRYVAAGRRVPALGRLLGLGRLRLPRQGVPAAAGRYFYGDYCSGTVWSLRIVDGKATSAAPRAVHGQGLRRSARTRPASST